MYFSAGGIMFWLLVISLVAALIFGGVKNTFARVWHGLLVVGVGIAATLATNSTEIYIGAMIAGTLMVMIGCYRVLAEAFGSNG